MMVRIRLFAMLRERAGRDELELELPDGARVADALAALDHLAGGLSLVLAVNREYAPPDAVLRAGDELALIPPVSGGMPSNAVRMSSIVSIATPVRPTSPRQRGLSESSPSWVGRSKAIDRPVPPLESR